MDAQKQGASSGYINQLRQERQNKINAQYGGRDPYRGSANIMGSGWSQRDRDRETISQPGGQLYYADGRKAVHNMGRPWEAGVDYSALAEQYAQKGNWDAVDDLLMRRAAKMQETGSRGGGRSNIDIWHDLNQRYRGPDSGMSLGEMQAGAEQVYGPGGKWGQSGSDGISPQGQFPPFQEGMMNGAFPSFQEYLDQTGYQQYSDLTKQYIQAAVDQAVNGIQGQMASTNQQSDQLARQAYINKMLGEKNLDQQLQAEGYAGGMAESYRLAGELSYQEGLRQIETQRLATIQELQRAISDAQLSGNMQAAQELTHYLQQIQGQWSGYVQHLQDQQYQNYWNQKQWEREDALRKEQWEREDYWTKQEMGQQEKKQAYEHAMNLLASGIMPGTDALQRAGISTVEAGAIRDYYLRQMTPAPTSVSSSGGRSRSKSRSRKRSSSWGSSSSSGSSGSNSGASQPAWTDAKLAKAAAEYYKENPNVALDSRTLDSWLNSNGIHTSNAQLFKEYLKKAGARPGRG